MEQLAIGIDIGGTGTKFGIVDRVGNLLFSSEMSTRKHDTIESFIEELHQKMLPMIDQAGGIGRFIGIGVGAPNGNYYSGTIEYAPNLPWKGIIPLAKMMRDVFHLPVVLTNDANAAAIGEMMYGAAKDMKDFIMITLGTGVGSGIVANGQLIYGHDGFAGELGHTIIIPDGRYHAGTGKHGSLESYASATGVVLTAQELLARDDQPSLLRVIPIEELDSKKVYEAAIKGDALAKEIFDFTGKILGMALANFVMFSSPEAIILFGGLTKSGDLLLKPVREHMENNLIQIFQNKVKILVSHLKESDAAILGASALVWEMKN
ncbi:MAG: ROK family protein [Chitinophagaceae bacterium]|jgi:glucokinase|nr:ROK family protein [Chitinophagaceae bacterium]MCA6492182.1 ROK family protein [Chitinophagaceae bacterium]MCA6498857.1 ROK family protein [Chitinophagaceae bacterium]MCA6511403.1 ROK family protein [Chitinophagaceae bacterium]MCE2972768.1 ROK family protein [Sediminibacterium sp.]